MLMQPFKYINAVLFRKFFYRWSKKEKEVVYCTFFGAKMRLLLPSSTDIYLTGGKSHESEIRLARFMINNLNSGDTFMDVGAHYGYFTLLGSVLVGSDGKVYSFEASPTTYKLLRKNTFEKTNIESHNLAVADEVSELAFYEFPNLYSEYNTLDAAQFRHESWFSEYAPRKISVKSIVLDEFTESRQARPKIVKIDVEGAECKVINGLSGYLSKNSPWVVMEYLSQERGNQGHQDAEKKLNSLGYTACTIDASGHLCQTDRTVSEYLEAKKLESDNIVFVKRIG